MENNEILIGLAVVIGIVLLILKIAAYNAILEIKDYLIKKK